MKNKHIRRFCARSPFLSSLYHALFDSSFRREQQSVLAGLVKYAISARNGQITLYELAAACGQREYTVLIGLRWLVAKGQVRFTKYDDRIEIVSGGAGDPASLTRLQEQIKRLLAEAQAYRQHWRTMRI